MPCEMVRLALHRPDTTMSKEQPLKHGAVVIWFRFGVECEEARFIIVLGEVEEYSRGFEDGN